MACARWASWVKAVAGWSSPRPKRAREQLSAEALARGLGLLELLGGEQLRLEEQRAQRVLGVRGVDELGAALAEVDLDGAVRQVRG